MSAVGGIEAISGVAGVLPSTGVSPAGSVGLAGFGGVDGVGATSGVPGASGAQGVSDPASAFAAAMGQGLEQVQALEKKSDALAIQAATGDLTDVHDYTIAANQAKLATELTVAVRNKAVEAFSEIMRMQA